MKKICFLLPINGISGGIFVVYTQAQALQKKGYDVTIAFDTFNKDNGLKHYNFSTEIKLTEICLIGDEEFDVAISTWWETFFSVTKIRAKKYMYFCQSDERKFYDEEDLLTRSLVELTYGFPNIGIVTEAKWIKSFLEADYGATVEYSPNGVDRTIFHPDGKLLEEKNKKGLRVLVEGPGSVPFKRIDDAFKIVNMFEGIEVWYVSSDGHVEPNWKFDRLISGVPYFQMGEIYRSCDILVKVSSVEGFFGPPLEMMACGGCCLVSNVTGYDEYVVDDYNALVVSVGNIDAGQAALEKLIFSKTLRETLSRNGLETANRFDWKDQTSKFEQAILALMERIPDSVEWEKKLIKRSFNILEGLKRKSEAANEESPDTVTLESQKVFFSVIIPVYDRTWELIECINSILKQTYTNFEIILVCDGSPLETIEVVNSFADDPRVSAYFYIDNSGNACRGRNKGIQMAKGEYISFIDSDDVAMPERLLETFTIIEKSNADIVSGRAIYMVDGTREIEGIKNSQVQIPYVGSLKEMEEANPFVMSTVSIKTSMLKKHGGFRASMRYREDHELFLRLIFNGATVSVADVPFVKYRIHEDNAELIFKKDDLHWESMALGSYRKNYCDDDWGGL